MRLYALSNICSTLDHRRHAADWPQPGTTSGLGRKSPKRDARIEAGPREGIVMVPPVNMYLELPCWRGETSRTTLLSWCMT